MSDTKIFDVPAMTCDHCRSAIEHEVGAVDGVERVTVDLDAKTVTVDGGRRDAIVAAIDEAGFDTA